MSVHLVDRMMHAYSRVTPTGRGAYRLVRLARRVRPREAGAQEFTLPSGIAMSLDPSQYPDCTMAYGLYERETVRVLDALLREGDIFIDGGANIGYFSLIAARRVMRSGCVHAFEPNAANAARLAANVRRNALGSQIRIHPEALSDRHAKLTLHSYLHEEANHGQATVHPRRGHPTFSTQVDAVPLDEILPDVKPRLVKLDVEGCELAALRGMARTIRRARPAVILEFNPVTYADAAVTREAFAEGVAEIFPGYTCSILRWPVRRLEIDGANLAAVPEANLLFLPRSAEA